MQDGTHDGMLSLLWRTPELCWRLNVRGATQISDVGPWNRAEPLEGHDFVIVAQRLLPVEQSFVFVRSLRGIVVVWIVDRENRRRLHSARCLGDE